MSIRKKEEGWVEHDGGPCPVDENVRVEIISKQGWSVTSEAWPLKWANITKYRVVAA